MNAIAQDHWQEQEDDPEVRIDARIDPRLEDAYWQSVYWSQPYYREDCDYEDYAPAFCVGYIGYAQYGGCLEEAEKSLCANWLRLKGDSRLSLDEALQAIRAAWDHAALGQPEADVEEEGDLVQLAPVPATAERQYATA